jgi:hypothetical protein
MNPPSVAGWDGDRSSINSSKLALRMRLASLLINGGVIGFEEDDPNKESQMLMQGRIQKKIERIGFSADWDYFMSQMDGLEKNEIITKAEAVFIPKKLGPIQKNLVDAHMVNGLMGSVLRMLSLPEYQTC